MTSAASSPMAQLQPEAVWHHFATLCRFPRASKHEAPLRNHLRQWASQRSLASEVDPAGNLLIRKPASAGCSASPGIVLQAHLDMICERNEGSRHDFSRDPIQPVLSDGWIKATDTTLGADNGLGVALMLALLEDTAAIHGPLEALFTVDEESGMGGARGLTADLLRGRLMLNLDTEQWGEFYLGCAGGLDVNVSRDGMAEPLPAGWNAWRIELSGLRGGHSGIDIQEGRGNAIKLLVRVLRALEHSLPLRLGALRGGTARNALPREATAVVALPLGISLDGSLALWQQRLTEELADTDPAVRLVARPDHCLELLCQKEQSLWLASLHAAPYGVKCMSRRLPGVVETSNNLGMVDIGPTAGNCNFMIRSLRDDDSEALAAEIASLFALSGTPVDISGRYPGWTPSPDSPLLARCQQVFRHEFDSEARIMVIHAGLECGLFKSAYPEWDMVSFGPTIRGAHAPGEKVHILAVERFWQLLVHVLEQIPAK